MKSKRKKSVKALVVIHSHPEGYPPTFNAINNLSKHCEKVDVLTTKTMETVYEYDKNVSLLMLPGDTDRFSPVAKSKFRKLLRYIKFLFVLRKMIARNSPDVVILYDNVPFLFYTLASKTIFWGEPIAWYHNHDVSPLAAHKKYSINWFAACSERRSLNLVDMFSLPANERKDHFPMKSFKGEYFFIPNYPSRFFHGAIGVSERKIENEIRLVYPGNICNKHGFEELIDILGETIDGKRLQLTLLGDVRESYKQELIARAKRSNAVNNLKFISRKSYFDIPEILADYHIGWGVNKPMDVTYSTGGTAANKIYEFLALGMPTLVFDNAHYRKHLDEPSVFFTDLSRDSVVKQVREIISDFQATVREARHSFETKFQFEPAFENALNRAIEKSS